MIEATMLLLTLTLGILGFVLHTVQRGSFKNPKPKIEASLIISMNSIVLVAMVLVLLLYTRSSP